MENENTQVEFEQHEFIEMPMAPVDVLQGLRPPPPEMDMSLWPLVLQTRALEISDSVGCDALVPLFAGLAAICGVVDARIRLELMPGFQVPPVLWLMTLGNPADKKSPGSRPMLSPLKDIEFEDRPRFHKELLEWEGKEAAYATAKKSFLDFSAAPVDGSPPPEVPDMPPQPVPLKITVSDITSQKLVRYAAERPRGLLCHLDEMNGWIKKLTDKQSGEDRSAWVVSYEAERYEMDRVGAGSIHCENLAVSIYGNIQPQVFRMNLASLASDGLLQRFIPAILRGNKTRLGNPVPAYMTSSSAWEDTLRLIYALPPQVYRLSADAYDAYRNFQAWYEGAKQDERLLNSSSEYMTAFGKLEGTAGRLILLMHLIENPLMPHVDVEVVNRVVHVIRSYVIPAFRYALGEYGGDDLFEQWMTDYVIQVSAETRTLDLRGLKRSARRRLENKNEWEKDQVILDAMHTLEKANWVRQVEEQMGKHHVIWVINPSIATMFKEYREKVIKAKQRHADYIYRYATALGKERKLVKGYDPETMD
jgi:hypothetical protein